MLLDDIITKLSDESQSLSDVLLKTKVLLADLDQPDLMKWVNRELNGYGETDELPEYRIVPAQVQANLVGYNFMAPHHPVPIGHLTAEQRKHLEHSEVRDGLAVVQALIVNPVGSVQRPIPMEQNGVLGKSLAEGVRINSAWVEIGTVQLANLVAQIRSRLLDFLLQLRIKVGRSTPDAEVKERAAGFDVRRAFENTVFQGPINIHIGGYGTQTITQQITAGDRDGLKKALRITGVPDEEIALLDHAIDDDTRLLGKPSIEGATGRWYTALLAKVGKGSIKIGMDVATAVVGATIMHYTGIKT